MFRDKNKFKVALGTFLCTMVSVFAQDTETKEEGGIGTERLLIVKAYTPTISDAFKVKSTPVFNDSITHQKKQVKYRIFSVPVASTFSPQKGRAATIDRPKKIDLYDNYTTIGIGNYTSALAEFYSDFQLNRTDNIGLYINHNSSQGGIDEVVLDTKFYDTSFDLNYTSRTRKSTFGIQLGAEHQLYNWYGLPSDTTITAAEIAAIDPQQNYYGANITTKLSLKDAIFNHISLNYRFFGDAQSSISHQANLLLSADIEMGDQLVTTDFVADYLQGSFDRFMAPLLTIPNEYRILNAGIQPSVLIMQDAFTLSLGAAAFLSLDNKNQDVDVYIYPQVKASYKLFDEAFIAYGGIEGGLLQNTYRDAVQENPFVSPTLLLTPTSNQFDVYVGLKGKISEVMSYIIRGSMISEDNKPLFVSNRAASMPLEGYEYGNSFSYRYDNILTTSGYGELNFTINKKFTLGVTATYYKYTTDQEQKAWNLPNFKASVFAGYQIAKEWSAGLQLFYVGERTDIDTTIGVDPLLPEATLLLDSYLDANINVGYRFNKQLSVFVKGNNLIGQNYQRWANYPVQGVQVLGGIVYKFDY